MQVPGSNSIGSFQEPSSLTVAQGYTANVHRVDGKFMTIDLDPVGMPLTPGPKPSFHLTVGGTHVTVAVSDARDSGSRPASGDELRDLKQLINGVDALSASEKQTILTALDVQIASGETVTPLPVFPGQAIPLKGQAAPHLPFGD